MQKNTKPFLITDEQESVPASIEKVGITVSTVTANTRRIKASDPSAFNQLAFTRQDINNTPHWWIYAKSEHEIKEVERFCSGSEILLREPFTNDLVNEPLFLIKPSADRENRLVEISAKMVTGDPLIDGIEYCEGEIQTFVNRKRSENNLTPKWVDPIDVDATGGRSVRISVQR